jgi:hypothetical protein
MQNDVISPRQLAPNLLHETAEDLVNITYQTPFPYPSPHPGKIIQSNPWVD